MSLRRSGSSPIRKNTNNTQLAKVIVAAATLLFIYQMMLVAALANPAHLSPNVSGPASTDVPTTAYLLSGSADGTESILVDDDLDVYLNGTQIYTDGTNPAGNRPPISVTANVGDTLRFVVRDTHGDCAFLSPIYLTAPNGNGLVADPGFNLGCGRPPEGVVHDVTFVIPNIPPSCSAGALDASFNGTGKVTTSIRGISDAAYSVAIQADGKIVTAGYSSSPKEFALVRYNQDGSLDTTFNSTGTVTTALPGTEAEAYSVAIQGDGKIVAAGYSYTGTRYEFALVRYNTDGSLDTTFNGTGMLTTSIRGIIDSAYSVLIQSDGKILATGYSYDSNYDAAFALVRYNTDGSLDATFNGTGMVITVIANQDVANSAALQADGKIVAAGFSKTGSIDRFALVRYNTDGSLDTTFNGTGKVTTTFGGGNDHVQSVAIQTDGKIVAAGRTAVSGTGYQIALARYNTDGSLDTTFNGTGKVTTSIRGNQDVANAVAIQTDGKIVAAGSSLAANYHFALVRYNTNGSLDTTFNGTGKVTTPVGVVDGAASVAIQTDGKIVAAGNSYDQSYEFAVVRYAADQCGGSTPTPTNTPTDTPTNTPTNTATNTPTPNTQAGSNVTVQSPSGDATVTFSNVTTAGTTAFTPIDPTTAGTPTVGLTFCPSCPAYDITTTATYTPPLTVCLFVPPSTDAATFAAMKMLHNEGGVYVDVTTSHITNPDTTREVCGTVNSLSPFAVAQPISITGTVTYGNAASPPKYVSNVMVHGAGSQNVSAVTDPPGATAGQYRLTGFGAGSYTVSLSKTTGQNGITSNDAARIAQGVAGTLPFTTNIQKVTADVSGNGVVSSTDAAKIAQFVAGVSPLPSPNLTGQWQFYVPPGPTFPVGSSPTSRTYSSVTSDLSGEDYIGLLIGEVTGNWVPSSARRTPGSVRSPNVSEGALGPERSIAVELPVLSAETGKDIVLPVNVRNVADKGAISYQFDLKYDPSVIQPAEQVADIKETASRSLSVVTNTSESGLRVVVYGAMPIAEDGVLLHLRFTAVGKPGSVTALHFDQIMFNEGDPSVITADGQIELSGGWRSEPPAVAGG